MCETEIDREWKRESMEEDTRTGSGLCVFMCKTNHNIATQLSRLHVYFLEKKN